MRISVNVDQHLMNEVIRRLEGIPQKAPTIVVRALNRAATNINANMKREIRNDYNIKASDIKESIKPVLKASRSSLFAEVKSSGNVIGLNKFKVVPKTINPRRKSPVKVAVKKGTPKPFKGAFMADVNGPKLFKRRGRKRFPIDRLFGPSVPQMLENDNIRDRIEQKGYETFMDRLDHGIDYELSRRSSR